jgi:hypothetical protein
MLTLIETLTAFTAIMLMLSLLVKTLTSVIKNQLDYYSDNLEHEVKRLVLETTGKAWDDILNSPNTSDRVKNILMDIHWERLGDEFMSPAHLSWFLTQLDQNARVSDLESRLKIHMANVKYTFEMRMKNLAVAVGLGLCLLCDVNAVTIWKSLYTDQQLRATFSNEYAKKASEMSEKQAQAASGVNGTAGTTPGAGATPGNMDAPKLTKAQADAQVAEFKQSMQGFLTDVSFGVGRIWKQDAKKNEAEDQKQQSATQIFIYEFFGSLLTGILISIGAPYWHDILQALSSLRSTPAPSKAKA